MTQFTDHDTYGSTNTFPKTPTLWQSFPTTSGVRVRYTPPPPGDHTWGRGLRPHVKNGPPVPSVRSVVRWTNVTEGPGAVPVSPGVRN